MKLFALTVLTTVMLCFASAENTSLPKGIKMYIVKSGGIAWAFKTETPLELGKNNRVCPTDFKKGFSIRCEPETDNQNVKVLFYLNSKFRRAQKSAPYFLNGNTAQKVRPMFFGNRRWIRVTCMADGFRRARVTLKIDCEQDSSEL